MTNLNENINYTVVISIDAVEFFESASGTLQKKLDRCFDRLKINPGNHPNIKSLKGELSGYYRYRVGDYRVIYEINDDLKLVTIIFIAHRSKVYE
ncbi:type II toxin-antitoxin system RelE/ParE family toxin [Anabaena aphanizomenioides LEGE 00250]|uniref:Type II toxin-antitoxin system RelE/ParE family toxin n=1 Tax=Sphaerospermopsis aphanizomenoides LEGE 00250 TaxID=2777972 RepID=A0ABR9VLJ3_9CYAN|nr:type II toxin-antitoxin system RelE/ParE family toxin [Sphaerospermopsis aphanizomenoides]MBE9239353.1 type II toxin-antitoxin system RelE/ParE family toxin [Sphaerospermopsis aphanizomenoides LEGE 00250]